MSVEEEKDGPDWGGALQSAISEGGSEEEDGPPLNVVASGGLAGASVGAEEEGELKYVLLLKAAVAMVKTGEITVEQYVEGVSKLVEINNNALKIYQIPAVKKELPSKLTEHQYKIVMALEEELYKQKAALEKLIGWADNQEAIDDLNTGLEEAVGAMNRMDEIKQQADTEKATIAEREKEEKARRVKALAEADLEDVEE